MAIFNPDVPNPNDSTPKWGRDSQPTSRWEGNTASEKLLSGLGDTLQIAAKGGDLAIKENINDEIWKKVNAEREAYSGSLELATNASSPQITSDGKVLAEASSQPPEAINRTLNYLENIKGGMEAGKVNDTYYKSRLVAIAKELRNSYPGYREYIDQKISGITGFDPANAKITDLLADINTLASSSKKDEAKTKALEIIKPLIGKVDGAAAVFNSVLSGGDASKAILWAEDKQKGQIELNQSKIDAELVKSKDEHSKFIMERHAKNLASSMVTNYVTSVQDSFDLPTVDQIKRFAADIRSGNVAKHTQEQITQIGYMAEQKAQNLKSNLLTAFRERNPQGQSIESVMGAKWVNDYVNEQTSELQSYADALKGKDAIAANFISENMKSRGTDIAVKMFDDQTLGKPLQILNGAKQALGDGITSRILEAQMFPTMLPALQNFMQTTSLAASTQEVVPNPRGPIVFKDTLDKAEQAQVPVASTANAALKNIQNIVDPSIPDVAKQGYIRYFFDTKNLGVLSKFNADQQGQVFESITSPGVIEEAYRVTRNKPELWNQVVNWTRQSFGKEFLNTELRDLAGYRLPDGASIMYSTDTHCFRVFYKGKDVTDTNTSPYVPERLSTGGETMVIGRNSVTGASDDFLRAIQGVQRINRAFSNVVNVAKKEAPAQKTTADAWMLQMMLDEGYDPRSGTAPISFPEHMIRAVASPAMQGYKN